MWALILTNDQKIYVVGPYTSEEKATADGDVAEHMHQVDATVALLNPPENEDFHIQEN